MKHPKPAVNPYYPRWVTLPDGNSLIVPNNQMHSALMGKEYDETGKLVHPEIVEPVVDTFGPAADPPAPPIDPDPPAADPPPIDPDPPSAPVPAEPAKKPGRKPKPVDPLDTVFG
jgi:hypothetical protein